MERFDSSVFFKEDSSIHITQIDGDEIRITITMGQGVEAWIDINMQGDAVEIIHALTGLSGNL